MKVVDMHCDTISELYKQRQQKERGCMKQSNLHIDLEKLQAGNYGLQNFALFVDLEETKEPYLYVDVLMQLLVAEIEACPEQIRLVRSWKEIEQNWQDGILSALLTLEEGGVCQGEVEKLRALYDGGARMMTLTWNYENELAYPNCLLHRDIHGEAKLVWEPDTVHRLKEKGIAFLEEMETLGMIIDISHLNDAGIWDVFRYTKKPFVASHSNARSITGHPRNLTDGMIRALSERGGVAGINFCPLFLCDEEKEAEPGHCYVADMVTHMEHMKQIGGIECIGLGSDFDGIISPPELPDASGMQRLADEMHRRRFTDDEIEAVFSKNVLRVYKEILSP